VPDRTELIAGYVRLVRKRTSFKFGLSYPIRNPMTGGHRYYLAHFCKYPDGYTHMANFMAKAERTVEDAAGDLLGRQSQMEFMAINEHLTETRRAVTVARIREALPEIWQRHGWHKSRVQNRVLFAAIVDDFGWSVLRSEYIEAMRALEKDGFIGMEGSEDREYTTFH
jgi:hypothetical protein